MEITLFEAILRILAAISLGAVIGFERELSMHPAGLRTHILVCMGATVFTILSISDLTHGLSFSSAAIELGLNESNYRIVRDPGRIAAQIVTGIGFIGGGAVLRHGATVRGLTTAASLWMAASIGMLSGTGYYVLSAISTLLAVLVLFLLGKVGRAMTKKHQKPFNRIRILITANALQVPEVQLWAERYFEDRILEVKTSGSNDGPTTLTYTINARGTKTNVNEVSRQINGLTGVLSSGIRMYYASMGDD